MESQIESAVQRVLDAIKSANLDPNRFSDEPGIAAMVLGMTHNEPAAEALLAKLVRALPQCALALVKASPERLPVVAYTLPGRLEEFARRAPNNKMVLRIAEFLPMKTVVLTEMFPELAGKLAAIDQQYRRQLREEEAMAEEAARQRQEDKEEGAVGGI